MHSGKRCLPPVPIKKMLGRQGIEAYVSPRPREKTVYEDVALLTVMREGLSYMLWTLHIT